MSAKELLRMEAELRQLTELAESTQAQMGVLQRQHNRIMANVKSLSARIENYRKEERIIKVSDHAIVRYMERVMGLDIDRIKDIIVSDEIRDQAIDIEDGAQIMHRNGFKLVVRDGTVVTILTKQSDKTGW